MTARSSLPGILGEIAEIAGPEAALKIAQEVGGLRVDIPAVAQEDHWLTRCVGFEAADLICRHLSVEDARQRRKGSVYHEVIPLGPTSVIKRARRQLADALLEGKSARVAAKESGLHERTAFRMSARMRRRNDDQGELF